MAANLGDIVSRVQNLVNDQQADVYTDAVLIPYINMAQDALAADMRDNAAPYITMRGATLSVAALVTSLSPTSTPALPAGLVEPLQLWERAASGAESDFVLMKGPITLPNYDQTEMLRYWNVLGDVTVGYQIQLLGATSAREVRIDGLYDLTQFADTADRVLIPGSANAITFRTAAYVAGSRGDDNAAKTFNNLATAETEKIISTQIKVQQSQPARRQPWSGIARYQVMVG